MKKRKLIIVAFVLLMVSAMTLSLTACGANKLQDNLDKVAITGNGTVRTVTDTRAMAYTAHIYDETAGEPTAAGDPTGAFVDPVDFASLYTAIDYVVANGDNTSYVTKKSGDDAGVKLFTKKAQYAADSKDMFYYYENGVSLDTYTQWAQTYWQDGKKLNGASVVFLSGEGNGLQPYYQGHSIVGANPKIESSSATPVWNVCQGISASVMVNLDAYCGITKAEYTVNLKEAKISPSMNTSQKVYAYLGFTVADAYNVSNMGIVCDTTTGNWHYYSGEMSGDATDFEIDTRVLMTSTWNETGKYFTPDENIVIGCEIITLGKGENKYPVDRLTVKFLDSKRTLQKDYEFSALTQSGTVRFNAYLDIDKPDGWVQPDFLNGAQFSNIVITKAEGTVHKNTLKPENYGDLEAKLAAGTYNLLNSATVDADKDARYQTVLYNSAFVNSSFADGKDVYSINFSKDTVNAPAYSTNIRTMNALIDAIPELGSLTEADSSAKVKPALDHYKSLSQYQLQFISNERVSKMKAAEMECLGFIYSADTVNVIEKALLLNEFYNYGWYIEPTGPNTVQSIKADTNIVSTYEAYQALSDANKINVRDFLSGNKGYSSNYITELHDFYLEIKDITDANVIKTINMALWIQYRNPLGKDEVYGSDPKGNKIDLVNGKRWTLDGRADHIEILKELVEGLDDAQLALLPECVVDILEDDNAYLAYLYQFTVTETLKTKIDALDSGAATYNADLAEVVRIWNTIQSTTSWLIRNNYGVGGVKPDWTKLKGLIDAHAGFEYGTTTGFINVLS